VPPPRQQRSRLGYRDGQLGRGLLQISSRVGYVLCHRARSGPQMLGDHPVRPSFTKPQISDSTSCPRHSPITARQRSTLHPCQSGAPGARRLPGHVFWRPGWPHPLPTPVLIDRSAGGYRAQQPSLCLRRAAGHHVAPQGSKPEGIPDGVFGRAPVPQGRPQSGEDLSTGRLRRRRRPRCRWRAGPGCRVPVIAESGIRTLRIPSPHRGGSLGSRPGHGGRQLAASRCTLETGEGSDGRRPHRRRGTARRHAADLG
jgi:hypothetical protein